MFYFYICLYLLFIFFRIVIKSRIMIPLVEGEQHHDCALETPFRPCPSVHNTVLIVLCQIQNQAWYLDFFNGENTLFSLRPTFVLFMSLELHMERHCRLPEQNQNQKPNLFRCCELLRVHQVNSPCVLQQKSIKTFSNKCLSAFICLG